MRNIEEIIVRQINRWNSIAQMLHSGGEGSSEPVAQIHATGLPLHPAIAVSHEAGSGAREICEIICERLGYDLMGGEIVEAVAREMNVQRQLIESLDERSRGELGLLIESFMTGHEIGSAEYLASLATVLNAMALKGGVILEGRGASVILQHRTMLNVRIIAPMEERVRRWMRHQRVDEEAARNHIEQSDRDRENFMRKYLKADPDDPRIYDLVINTARLAPRQAAELVFKTLELRGFDPARIAIAHDNSACSAP